MAIEVILTTIQKVLLTTLEIRVLKRLSFPTAWVKCGLGDYAASDYGMTADSNPSLKMKPCC